MAKRITVRVPDEYSTETKEFMKKVVKALNENGGSRSAAPPGLPGSCSRLAGVNTVDFCRSS